VDPCTVPIISDPHEQAGHQKEEANIRGFVDHHLEQFLTNSDQGDFEGRWDDSAARTPLFNGLF